MAFNKKEQDIIKYGIDGGKSKVEIEQALKNYRLGIKNAPTVLEEKKIEEPSYIERLGEQYKSGFEGITEGIEKGAEKVATGVENIKDFGKTGDTDKLSSGIMQTIQGFARSALRTVGEVAQKAFAPITELVAPSLTKIIQSTVESSPTVEKALQNVSSLVSKYPEQAKDIQNVVDIVALGLGGASENTILSATEKVLTKITTESKGIIQNISDDVLQSATKLRDNARLFLSKKNVEPQLKESAERLFMEGTKRVDEPLQAYEKYLSQSKGALTDIKIDPAISEVGGKIGNAFENVIKQRSEIGKVIGKELESVGKLKVSITEAKESVLSNLKNSGLSYNSKTKSLTAFGGTKFTQDEISMLNRFVKDLNSLGENPTVKDIDNFVSRMRTELDFAKGKSGVMGTTNAERIITGGISEIKGSLNPEKNGLSQLSDYWSANKMYSELSEFIKEGESFLGKVTQSGDFAKDASLAKSSVQSILNNGKKDWLLKLEGLTGYNALDDAVLALQAMKDAGDFRGLSLLQTISESGLPSSKAGITQKIVDYALQKGGEFIAGSPEEQTRILLRDIQSIK